MYSSNPQAESAFVPPEHTPPPFQDAKNQIRLLQPTGGRTPEETVLCLSLGTYYRSTAPAYRAISYTWGDEEGQRLVSINGEVRYVRRNCHYALWQAALHFPGELLWIDSICINQADVYEKSIQVSNMGETYRCADLVLACVGPHEDDSDWLASLISADEAGLIEKCKNAPEEYEDLRTDRRLWDAYKKLACREYWTRVWVVPENVNAVEVQVLVGDAKIFWSTMEVIERASQAWPPYLMPQGCFRSMSATRSRKSHSIRMAVDYFSAPQCADPRDRIYAHCSIIDWASCYPDEPPLRCDYSLSSFELAQKLVRYTSQIDIDRVVAALRITEADGDVANALSRRRSGRQHLHDSGIGADCSRRVKWHIGQRTIVRLYEADRPNELTAAVKGHGYFEHELSFLRHLQATANPPIASQALPIYGNASGTLVQMGITCRDARPGDLLCEWQSPSHCLVLRHNHAASYDIIGQAILSGSAPSWRPTEFSDSPIDERPRGESLKGTVSLTLSAEDVVVYTLQGLFERQAGSRSTDSYRADVQQELVYLEKQLSRLETHVTADPCRAATLTDLINPLDDPDWETTV